MFEKKKRIIKKFRLIFSLIIISFSFYISLILINNPITYCIHKSYLLLLMILVWIPLSYKAGLYDEFREKQFGYELIALAKSMLLLLLITVVILFIFKEQFVNRKFTLYFAIIALFLFTFERLSFRKLILWYRSRGRNIRHILIIGAGEVGNKIYSKIESNPQYGYKVFGFLDDKIKNKKIILGNINSLSLILSNNKIHEVIVALPNYAYYKIGEVIKVCRLYTVRTRIIPDYFGYCKSKFSISHFDEIPILNLVNDKITEYHNRILKRSLDLFILFIISVLFLWWFLPIIAVIIKIDSSGPIFYKQNRWGQFNKKFKAYKFRTMISDSTDVDKNGKYLQAQKDDSRITKIGKFLRRTNIDELPQFFNVLKGDMSIIGPRPHPIPMNLEFIEQKLPDYMLRTLVKPGITGWAQVNGWRGPTDEDYKIVKRVEFDLWYIENWTFWLDIKIIFMTVFSRQSKLNAF